MALYQAPSPADLITTPLDGLTALYHRPSGQTHVMMEPMPAILTALAHGALPANALLNALGIDEPAEEDHAGLHAHLDLLVSNGLVWRHEA